MAKTPIEDMKLTGRHIGILAVCSMEQMIGAAQSALVGIILPMLLIVTHNGISSELQGVTGAIGLIGIAIGSAVIGRISDVKGYALLFRLCPLLIMAGSLLAFFCHDIYFLIVGLFISGIGIGGGYSLDSSYISELMPRKWSLMMVGVAKATSALGFIGISLCCWLIIRATMNPDIWKWLLLLITALGLCTLLFRLHYPDSPRWLMGKGKVAEAQKAAQWFYGPNAEVIPETVAPSKKKASWGSLFKGRNILKVIFSGIPWACEGVGVYGIGIFLPALIMALGIDKTQATGMAKILNSVEYTTIVNCFILPGFVIGLLIMRKVYHVAMLTWGFVLYSIGVGIVMAAYVWSWPIWMSILGFLIFQVSLNGGPHLITFIIPSQIYSVDERGAGTGIATMIGKIGAICGVFFMPVLLRDTGIKGVLIFCIAIGLAGAIISAVFGRLVLNDKR